MSYLSEREKDTIDGEVHFAVNNLVETLQQAGMLKDMTADLAMVLEEQCNDLQKILKHFVEVNKRNGNGQT